MPRFSRFTTVLVSLAALASSAFATARPWKSADGQRSVQGLFVKRDASSVTILRDDSKQVVIPLDQLHPDDLAWVNANHPLAATPAAKPLVFDQLSFGDTRAQVLEKLKASKFVAMIADETFLGRSGLNGAFRTRRKIGGLDASLYFDWTGNDQLKEITLQTDALPASDRESKLVPCWKEFVTLLTTLQGKPLHAEGDLHLTSLQEGSMMPTHLWKLEPTGSAMLGAARSGDRYQVVVRFTTRKLEPVALP